RILEKRVPPRESRWKMRSSASWRGSSRGNWMKNRTYTLVVLWLALASFAALPGIVRAQAAVKPKLADELEDDLLKDLPGPVKSKPEKPAARSKREDEKKLLQNLEGGEDIGAPPENPLARIG